METRQNLLHQYSYISFSLKRVRASSLNFPVKQRRCRGAEKKLIRTYVCFALGHLYIERRNDGRGSYVGGFRNFNDMQILKIAT